MPYPSNAIGAYLFFFFSNKKKTRKEIEFYHYTYFIRCPVANDYGTRDAVQRTGLQPL